MPAASSGGRMRENGRRSPTLGCRTQSSERASARSEHSIALGTTRPSLRGTFRKKLANRARELGVVLGGTLARHDVRAVYWNALIWLHRELRQRVEDGVANPSIRAPPNASRGAFWG